VTFYRQCTLKKGAAVEVAWIPEELATKGKFLRIRDDDGWQVVEVSALRQNGEYLQEHERDHIGHRSRTDV